MDTQSSGHSSREVLISGKYSKLQKDILKTESPRGFDRVCLLLTFSMLLRALDKPKGSLAQWSLKNLQLCSNTEVLLRISKHSNYSTSSHFKRVVKAGLQGR
nr:hypothetical protein BgiMline_009962 [Biomphalaria glabrata]